MTGKSLQGEDNSRAGSVGEGGQDGRCDSPMQIDVTDCLEGLMPGEMGHHNKVCLKKCNHLRPPHTEFVYFKIYFFVCVK